MNKHYTVKGGISLLSCIFLFLLLSFPSFADTNFGGYIDNDYFKSGNWTNGLPASNNNGTIPSGSVVNINNPLSIDGFTLTSYGTINANAAVTVIGTLNNYTGSAFHIGAAGSLTNKGTMDQRGTMTIAPTGSFVCESTANYSSTGTSIIENEGMMSVAGNFNNLGIINNNNQMIVTGGIFNNNTAINNKGTMLLSGGTLTSVNGASILCMEGATISQSANGILFNAGTVFNNGTYTNNGKITNNGTIASSGLFNNNFGGEIVNNFRLNSSGTFNNNNQGKILNGFELNNAGVFSNNFQIDNGGTVKNLAGGMFNNAASGVIENKFGSLVINENIFSNIGEIISVGEINNTATFTNKGSIHTNTGGAITNSGNFTNDNLLKNLEKINNSGIFTNNSQLENNSGGVFTNSGDLYNNPLARISNDYELYNNQNLYNYGAIENGVRVFNNAYFENHGILINLKDFYNNATGIFENVTSTGEIQNNAGGVFSNLGTLNNYYEIHNFSCSSFVNKGIINNYYWFTNWGIFFNTGTFNELPYHIMDENGGVTVTGADSDLICQDLTINLDDQGQAVIFGSSVAVVAFNSCSDLFLTVNDQQSLTYTCANLGTYDVILKLSDRQGNSVTCHSTVTVKDATAPSILNCPAEIIVTTNGTSTNVNWTAPTAIDNCGPVTLTSNKTPGSAFPIGTTTVTYNAADGAGNGSIPCSFNVIVVPQGDCADVASIRKVSSTSDYCGNWCGGAYAFTFGPGDCYTAGPDLLFIEYTNGTAILTGSIYQGSKRGFVEVNLSGKTTSAPSGSPKYELCVNSGANDWTYYPAFEGMIKLDDCRTFNIKRYGPAFQLGMGGNLQDPNMMGASGWITTDGGAHHGGDFNFRLSAPVDCQNSIYLEAECADAIGSNWQIKTDAQASSGKLLLPPNKTSYDYPPVGTADVVKFNVNVTVAGYYRLFARTIVPDGSGDSYWVKVNSGNWVKWNTVNSPNYTGYQWDQVGDWNGCTEDIPVTFQLNAGSNTIEFSWREPNACLDKLYLTLTGKKPTGLGGEAKNCNTNSTPSGECASLVNLALGKYAYQSSTDYSGSASRAIDGNTNGVYSNNSVTHTKSQCNAYWELDLGEVNQIEYVNLWNRTDCCTDRLSDFYVLVSDNPFSGTLSGMLSDPAILSKYYAQNEGVTTRVDVNRTGRYLCVMLKGCNTLSLAEVEVMGCSITATSPAPVPPAPPVVTCNKKALFVVGSTYLNSSDSKIKARLEGLGYSVTVKDDYYCQSSDSNDKGLVLISSTCNSGYVGSKFRDVAVPVIVWEGYLMDDMKMTGSTVNYHFGSMNYVSKMTINDSNHPICQGMSGNITLFNNCSKTVTWGKPSSGASRIGYAPGNPNCVMMYTYDSDSDMAGMRAPARRVGMYLHDDSAPYFSSSSWLIFDRTVQWASGCDLGINAKGEEEILKLKAVRNDRMVNLYWTNNTGFKNEFFIVEKSADGVNFEVMNETYAYSDEDKSTNLFEDFDFEPATGENYYRVTVTFLNGTQMQSEVQVVEMIDIEDFSLYPNPASSYTNINLENLAGHQNLIIRVYDVMGRQVEEIKLDEVTEPDYRLELSNYEKGRYTVSVIKDKGRPVTKKLVISK